MGGIGRPAYNSVLSNHFVASLSFVPIYHLVSLIGEHKNIASQSINTILYK